MLVLYYPKQVPSVWPLVKQGLIESLPPYVLMADAELLNNLLQAMLAGDMQLWMLFAEVEPVPKPFGFAVTTITDDFCSKTKNLLLYSIYAAEAVPPEEWSECLQGLEHYARANGCQSIVAYATSQYVIQKAAQLGADVSQRFLRFPLEGV